MMRSLNKNPTLLFISLLLLLLAAFSHWSIISDSMLVSPETEIEEEQGAVEVESRLVSSSAPRLENSIPVHSLRGGPHADR
jgi:hypothetical protein